MFCHGRPFPAAIVIDVVGCCGSGMVIVTATLTAFDDCHDRDDGAHALHSCAATAIVIALYFVGCGACVPGLCFGPCSGPCVGASFLAPSPSRASLRTLLLSVHPSWPSSASPSSASVS